MGLILIRKMKDFLIKRFKMQIISFKKKSRRLRKKSFRSLSHMDIFGGPSFVY